MVFVCSEGIAFTEGESTNGGGSRDLGGGPGVGSVSFSSLVVESLS